MEQITTKQLEIIWKTSGWDVWFVYPHFEDLFFFSFLVIPTPVYIMDFSMVLALK